MEAFPKVRVSRGKIVRSDWKRARLSGAQPGIYEKKLVIQQDPCRDAFPDVADPVRAFVSHGGAS